MLTLMTGLAVLLAAQAPDTTVAVRRGQRLDVAAHAGSVRVEAWNRDAVRTRLTDGSRGLRVETSGSRVAVEVSGRYREPVEADLVISAPAWMPVTVSGVDLDVTVDGIEADVTADTQADVIVRGGSGVLALTSVNGDVSVRGARGQIEANTVNGDVTISGADGTIAASTVNGDVGLVRVTSTNVAASTVSGDVDFSGAIRSGGSYRFSSHNGDLTVAVPADASAVVSVSSFAGDFEAAFPVTLTGMRRGQRFSFTLGSGAARLELESFQGDIRLVRPGAAAGTR